jgi:fermentation-respiration switch protein FrsA (DUF1100 family)
MRASRVLLGYTRALLGSTNPGWRVLRIMALVAVGLLILIMVFEDRLIYFPARYPEGRWHLPDLPVTEGSTTAKVEDCYFTASDGIRLHGWFCTPQRKIAGSLVSLPAAPVILWFHGNAGNITTRYEMIRFLMEIPARVFIIDYRGYGKSEGWPSEKGLYLDAEAAWEYLTNDLGVGPENIVILGKSLGGAPAIDLATKVSPAGLIVQSSFTSAADMAAAVMPVFPRFMLRTKMDSINKIRNISCPKLFIHSPGDEVVPFELGRRLFDAAPEPKQFYTVEGAHHNDTYLVGGSKYLEALRSFVQECTLSRPQ